MRLVGSVSRFLQTGAGGLRQHIEKRLPILAHRAIDPGLRIGARVQRAQQVLGHGAHFLGPAAKIQRVEIAVERRVRFFQRLVQRLVLHAAGVGLVQHAETRAHARGLKMRAQELGAKAVDGGDGGAFQAHGLFFQRAACLHQPPRQFGAQFRGRRARERDDEHLVDVRALGQQLHHALHQHRGFARTGRRRDQQIFPARFYGRALFLCEWHGSSAMVLDVDKVNRLLQIAGFRF